MREKMNKKIFLFLQLSYSAILHVESHCSTIANFFCNGLHLQFRMLNSIGPECQFSLHLTFRRPNANALTYAKPHIFCMFDGARECDMSIYIEKEFI